MSIVNAPTSSTTAAPTYVGIAIDRESVIQSVAKNWGWIMAAGVVSVLGGFAALLTPVLATGVTAIFIATTLLVVGSINVAGVFFAEKSLKLESFLTGVVQILLAAVMAFYPFASLMSMTILIAAFMMADGAIRSVLAVQNRQVTGWGWSLVGGLASIATSAIVIVALPSSALWVIGIMVGVSLLTTGAAKIAIASNARKLAPAAE